VKSPNDTQSLICSHDKARRVVILSITDGRDRNGVTTFLSIFSGFRHWFLEHGFSINMILSRPFSEKKSRQNFAKSKSSITYSDPNGFQYNFFIRSKRLFKKIMLLSAFGSLIVFIYSYVLQGLIVALRSRLRLKADILFYQDVFVAAWGLYLHPSDVTRILIFHSDFDVLSQLFFYFPQLKGTIYERLLRYILEKTVNKQDALVVLGNGIAQELANKGWNVPIKTIYNTCLLDLTSLDEAWPRNNSRLRIVCVGSLQRRKGFDLVVEAISLLNESDQEKLDVVVIGDGPDRLFLESLIKSRGVAKTIWLAGSMNDVMPALKSADVFLLSSRNEGLPIAMIEAMSVGLPILTTRVGAIPELFDETECLYIDTTPEAIAERFRDLCQMRYDLDLLSVHSRRIYDEKLSMHVFLGNYLSLFKEFM